MFIEKWLTGWLAGSGPGEAEEKTHKYTGDVGQLYSYTQSRSAFVFMVIAHTICRNPKHRKISLISSAGEEIPRKEFELLV